MSVRHHHHHHGDQLLRDFPHPIFYRRFKSPVRPNLRCRRCVMLRKHHHHHHHDDHGAHHQQLLRHRPYLFFNIRFKSFSRCRRCADMISMMTAGDAVIIMISIHHYHYHHPYPYYQFYYGYYHLLLPSLPSTAASAFLSLFNVSFSCSLVSL